MTKLGRVYKKDCSICGKVRLCHSLLCEDINCKQCGNNKIHGYICKICKSKLMLLTNEERKKLYAYAVKIGFIIPTEDSLKKTINAMKASYSRSKRFLDKYKAELIIEKNKVTLLEAKLKCLERLVKGKRTFRDLEKSRK